MSKDFHDFEGRRFYWDGRTYASPEEAAEAADGYREGGFEVRLLEEAEGHLVYSRREAQAGQP